MALAKKGIKKLPSLNKDFLFTEKFKKVIDHFVSSYNFPDFVNVVNVVVFQIQQIF
jgi:hypothetical protein